MRLPSLSRPRSTDKCCTPSSGFSSENSILGRAEMKRLKKTGDLAPKASRYISIVQTVTVMCMIPGVSSLCKDPTSYNHRGISKWNPSDNPTSNKHSADKKGKAMLWFVSWRSWRLQNMLQPIEAILQLPHPLAITVTSFDLPEGYQDSNEGVFNWIKPFSLGAR